jgi:micrococcal nuclease
MAGRSPRDLLTAQGARFVVCLAAALALTAGGLAAEGACQIESLSRRALRADAAAQLESERGTTKEGGGVSMLSKRSLSFWRPILIAFAICATALSAVAGEITGRVVAVPAGDRLRVASAGAVVTVRLAGVACPEKGQPYAEEARRFTSKLALRTVVTVRVTDRDRAGHSAGEVTLMDGKSLNREVLRAGYGWWHQYTSKDGALREIEREARRQRRGLWRDSEPQPPWEFKRKKKPRGTKTTRGRPV